MGWHSAFLVHPPMSEVWQLSQENPPSLYPCTPMLWRPGPLPKRFLLTLRLYFTDPQHIPSILWASCHSTFPPLLYPTSLASSAHFILSAKHFGTCLPLSLHCWFLPSQIWCKHSCFHIILGNYSNHLTIKLWSLQPSSCQQIVSTVHFCPFLDLSGPPQILQSLPPPFSFNLFVHLLLKTLYSLLGWDPIFTLIDCQHPQILLFHWISLINYNLQSIQPSSPTPTHATAFEENNI